MAGRTDRSDERHDEMSAQVRRTLEHVGGDLGVTESAAIDRLASIDRFASIDRLASSND